ncbi:AtpZ/AtpI family protein [Nitrosovibrio sp. Nv4]|uniref:AtpZ/AtpI family protein n=1 Tax=Nitrosovibrio sp. Nv4 TaxID=1945880 RepID=UPI000BC75840|nr:AtpZ/AtpI family protein [Nitrosovibrio sp. Nv4]SOD41406.1 ATP synthase protein I [Nitrosovibrio sp. Nv4]
MSDPSGENHPEEKHSTNEPELSRRVGARAARKLQAQRAEPHVKRTAWSGLTMIGLVGWSVVVPTLLGAALGVWLDRRYAMNHSWTLTLLFAGLVVGCLNAWHWIVKEDRETHKQQENHE